MRRPTATKPRIRLSEGWAACDLDIYLVHSFVSFDQHSSNQPCQGTTPRHVTSSPRARSSCTSHGGIGPVSTPILAPSPACPLTIRSICLGPWRTARARAGGRSRPPRRSPSASVTRSNQQIGSSNRLSWCEPPGDSARIAASWMAYAPAAITRCPHMRAGFGVAIQGDTNGGLPARCWIATSQALLAMTEGCRIAAMSRPPAVSTALQLWFSRILILVAKSARLLR